MMKIVFRVTLFFLKFLIVSLPVLSADFPEIKYLASTTTLSDIEIVDVTCTLNDEYYAIDANSECICLFALSDLSDDSLIQVESSILDYLEHPRSIIYLMEENQIAIGDKTDEGGGIFLHSLDSEPPSFVPGVETCPVRLFQIDNGFLGCFFYYPTASTAGYRVLSYIWNEQNNNWSTRNIEELEIEVENVADDIYRFISSYPRLAACNMNDDELAIIGAYPSTSEYRTFFGLNLSSGAELTENELPDPYASWTDVQPRDSIELEVLEERMQAIDPLFSWNEDNRQSEIAYRTIVNEIGNIDDELWVVRTTGEYPVFDVYDLSDDNKPIDRNSIELSEYAKEKYSTQSEQDRIWQYRIINERIIAFCSNQIYVFEI